MLARLIVFAMQVAAGWFGGPAVAEWMPNTAGSQIFILAVAVGFLVWLVGLVGSISLKEVGQPSLVTLGLTTAAALVFAALTLVEPVTSTVASAFGAVPLIVYPLAGALMGYAVR